MSLRSNTKGANYCPPLAGFGGGMHLCPKTQKLRFQQFYCLRILKTTCNTRTAKDHHRHKAGLNVPRWRGRRGEEGAALSTPTPRQRGTALLVPLFRPKKSLHAGYDNPAA